MLIWLQIHLNRKFAVNVYEKYIPVRSGMGGAGPELRVARGKSGTLGGGETGFAGETAPPTRFRSFRFIFFPFVTAMAGFLALTTGLASSASLVLTTVGFFFFLPNPILGDFFFLPPYKMCRYSASSSVSVFTFTPSSPTYNK